VACSREVSESIVAFCQQVANTGPELQQQHEDVPQEPGHQPENVCYSPPSYDLISRHTDFESGLRLPLSEHKV